MKQKTIYHLKFFDPVDNKTDYYFSSISSVFDRFTVQQVGVAQQTLYQNSLKVGDEYRSKYCVIKKEQLISKPR